MDYAFKYLFFFIYCLLIIVHIFFICNSVGVELIEQQISILKNRLNISIRRNPKVGGTLGQKTEIDVDFIPLNLNKLFNKMVYHIDVLFEPVPSKKLLRKFVLTN